MKNKSLRGAIGGMIGEKAVEGAGGAAGQIKKKPKWQDKVKKTLNSLRWGALGRMATKKEVGQK